MTSLPAAASSSALPAFYRMPTASTVPLLSPPQHTLSSAPGLPPQHLVLPSVRGSAGTLPHHLISPRNKSTNLVSSSNSVPSVGTRGLGVGAGLRTAAAAGGGTPGSVPAAPKATYYKKKICSHPGCKTPSKSKGLCKKHGGAKRCSFPDCTKNAKTGGACIAHGGGLCCIAGCKSGARRNRMCHLHNLAMDKQLAFTIDQFAMDEFLLLQDPRRMATALMQDIHNSSGQQQTTAPPAPLAQPSTSASVLANTAGGADKQLLSSVEAVTSPSSTRDYFHYLPQHQSGAGQQSGAVAGPQQQLQELNALAMNQRRQQAAAAAAGGASPHSQQQQLVPLFYYNANSGRIEVMMTCPPTPTSSQQPSLAGVGGGSDAPVAA